MEISLRASGPVKGYDFMEALAENVPVSDRLALRVTVGGSAFNSGTPGQFRECVGALNGFQGGEILISVPDALSGQEAQIRQTLMAVLSG
jgi:hypothetical protein